MLKQALGIALIASVVGMAGCASRAETVGTAGGAAVGYGVGGAPGAAIGALGGYEAGKIYDKHNNK